MASVKVAVRVRPFNNRERQLDSSLVVKMSGNNQVTLEPCQTEKSGGLLGDKHRSHNFTFDHSYWSHSPNDFNFVSQQKVFTDLGLDVIKNAFDGYNACVFAYGQTGSGKTYTMMGSEQDRGLIPRICETMFQRMSQGKEEGTSYRCEVSYLEIYNEHVKDLLKKNSTHNLKVREHPTQGPYVQDLSKHLVCEYRDILRLMEQGNELRTTASTNMNDTSSRSHAIFTITFVQAGYLEGMPHETKSKIHLVDLAGSERANATGATGQRLKEGAHINKSLVTLGSVISALAEASSKQSAVKTAGKGVFIPYRDSVLTWLLKDSLGGNSKTIMIATISPADVNHGETLSTLRYANRAKNIINKPTVNEDANVKLIRELREEIDRLKAIMSGDPEILSKVQEQLAQKEAREQKLTQEWNEKWREAAKILSEHNALGLKKTGLGVVLDSDKPHLIGLDEDILSTGITLYQLREGDTLIGSVEATELPHIILKGPSILPLHCTVRLEGGVATLVPAPGALCLVNAAPADSSVRLSQGCVVVLGKTNMFRYNDPLEAADLRKNMEKSKKAPLMNQSLMSQSLSDLRHTPAKNNPESRMFSSDGDIQDTTEGGEEAGPHGFSESVETLQNSSSDSSPNGGTPRLAHVSRTREVPADEEAGEAGEASKPGGGERPQLLDSSDEYDHNANPTSHSTPCQNRPAKVAESVVSPVADCMIVSQLTTPSDPGGSDGASDCTSRSEGSSVVLSQLYHDISDQKDVIMACLEEDNCDIDQLNAEIAKLQSMQQKYARLDFESSKSLWLSQSGEDVSYYQDKFALLVEAEVDKRLEAENMLRHEKEKQERELLLLEKEKELERLRQHHEREMFVLKKKLSEVRVPSSSVRSPQSCPYQAHIPRYHTVGVGKHAYVEYEVEISLLEQEETRRLFRRFRQFRDLHMTLCNKYGLDIQSLHFPSRKLFGSRSDQVSSERQRELQTYLNRLMAVGCKIASCPMYGEQTMDTLVQFAAFFQTNSSEALHS